MTTFIIIGSGESAKHADFDLIKQSGFPVIAVNNAYTLYPDASILAAADAQFYKHYRPEFSGMKFCRQSYKGAFCYHTGEMPVGLNSGAYACYIAKGLNARKIILVGFDMKYGESGAHFHGNHPHGLKNPTQKDFDAWKSQFENFKACDIINTNLESDLLCFPKIKFEKAIYDIKNLPN